MYLIRNNPTYILLHSPLHLQSSVGGKGLGLQVMSKIGVDVPPG